MPESGVTKHNYLFCQFVNPTRGHEGDRCDCFDTPSQRRTTLAKQRLARLRASREINRASTSNDPESAVASDPAVTWTTDKSPPSLKNTPSPTHHTSATFTPAYTAPMTAMKTPSYPCSRGSSSYSPAPPIISTRYTKRPRDGSTGRPWQRYSASVNWSTPLLTHSAASTSSKPKYRVPSKPKTRLKDAWRQRTLTAPWATSAPYPTWEGGTSGSSGRTLRRGSSIVNEDIDI